MNVGSSQVDPFFFILRNKFLLSNVIEPVAPGPPLPPRGSPGAHIERPGATARGWGREPNSNTRVGGVVLRSGWVRIFVLRREISGIRKNVLRSLKCETSTDLEFESS